MIKTPRVELLTPDLDLAIRFVPAYELLQEKNNRLGATELASIALTLWELSNGAPVASDNWRSTQLDRSFEGDHS